MKKHLACIVVSSVEETLNSLLDAEANEFFQARRYERNSKRASTRDGHYQRKLLTSSGTVKLNVPKLRDLPFETAIIERYRRLESSVEESLVEMYLVGVLVRRIKDITEALWGAWVSPSTVSELNHIERLNREIRRRTRVVGSFPDVHSALMLVCTRLRYMATSKWGTERYLRMAATAEE